MPIVVSKLLVHRPHRSLAMFAFLIGIGMAMGLSVAKSAPASAEACSAGGNTADDGGRTAVPRPNAAFPLRINSAGRFLEDSEGTPFLIHGDTAWSLMTQLTREEVAHYLEDRRARGFNAILISLIEASFAHNAPANVYGEKPFQREADYSVPNEAYFDHADWVLRLAAEKGFLVLMTPSYLGYGGGSEGWYGAMIENGEERLYNYGRYLGRRYQSFDNILWVHAGDYNPPQKELVRAIAQGIRAVDQEALHTAHGSPETAALDYWQGEPWLEVNNIYTYKPVGPVALTQYKWPEPLPFFLLESAYENEHDTTEQRLRAQAYEALLSGAAGQIFGNNPIWHFDGPGLYPAPVTWKEALDSRGARSMTHLYELMSEIPWWRLKPDPTSRFLIYGQDTGVERASVARTEDGDFAIIYVSDDQEITLDLGALADREVLACWYDPSTGQIGAIDGSPFATDGAKAFRPASKTNGAGFSDWVLILTLSDEAARAEMLPQ